MYLLHCLEYLGSGFVQSKFDLVEKFDSNFFLFCYVSPIFSFLLQEHFFCRFFNGSFGRIFHHNLSILFSFKYFHKKLINKIEYFEIFLKTKLIFLFLSFFLSLCFSNTWCAACRNCLNSNFIITFTN